MGFDIKGPNECFRIYEILNSYDSIKIKISDHKKYIENNNESIENIENTESVDKEEIQDILESLSIIAKNLKSIEEEKPNDRIFLGHHWPMEIRLINIKYWLNKAAEGGHKEAQKILASDENDFDEIIEQLRKIKEEASSEVVEEEKESKKEENDLKNGCTGCLIWIVILGVLYKIFF